MECQRNGKLDAASEMTQLKTKGSLVDTVARKVACLA